MNKTSMRRFHSCAISYAKKLHWAKEAVKKTHVHRALEHFDDFYASVYKDRWPSMRLALLCAPKYMAIPNVFTGDENQISDALAKLGGISIADTWKTHSAKIEKELEALELRKAEKKLRSLDSKMEEIAVTKVAEEMDILYQNAPRQKLLMEQFVSQESGGSRLLKDIREASQEYVTETRLKGAEDFVMESEYFTFYANQMQDGEGKQTEFQFTSVSNYKRLKFPPMLRPYAFEPGSPETFPSAGLHHLTGLRDFICINGGSIAPVIALDLIPGVSLLDLCSGPGTKALLAYMTSCPETMTCNDVDAGRIRRVKNLFSEFMGRETPANISFTRGNAAFYGDEETKYSRILADVPCLSDRVSCTIPDNNIFKPTRTKERIGLVQVQKNILLSAFRSLLQETGSAVVYSTCTLSPVENDGAVGAALRESEVPGLHVDLLGLWTALKPLQEAGFFFMNRTKFGVLIEPNIVSNFGPMFISRIVYIEPVVAEEHNPTLQSSD